MQGTLYEEVKEELQIDPEEQVASRARLDAIVAQAKDGSKL